MNTVYFSKEDVINGVMSQVLEALIAQSNIEENECYNEIHILPIEPCVFAVSWVQGEWDGSSEEGFFYEDEDDCEHCHCTGCGCEHTRSHKVKVKKVLLNE